MYFYELGKDDVKLADIVAGGDSDIIAIGKKPNGSLILKTGDSNFAYWLTSFAGSPIPTVSGGLPLKFQLLHGRAPAVRSVVGVPKYSAEPA